jgi:hypothetical protein
MTGNGRKKQDPQEILAFVEWMREHRYTELSIQNMMHKIRGVYAAYPHFQGLPECTYALDYLYNSRAMSHSAVSQYRRAYNRLYDFLEDTR